VVLDGDEGLKALKIAICSVHVEDAEASHRGAAAAQKIRSTYRPVRLADFFLACPELVEWASSHLANFKSFQSHVHASLS
jgi:hypothetical protein